MDIQYMELALQQAETAYRLGEVPIGAVIVRENEVISIASCRNCSNTQGLPKAGRLAAVAV